MAIRGRSVADGGGGASPGDAGPAPDPSRDVVRGVPMSSMARMRTVASRITTTDERTLLPEVTISAIDTTMPSSGASSLPESRQKQD